MASVSTNNLSWLSEFSDILGLNPGFKKALEFIVCEEAHKLLDDPKEMVLCPKEIISEEVYISVGELEFLYRDKMKSYEEEIDETQEEINTKYDFDKIYARECKEAWDYYEDEIDRLTAELEEIREELAEGLVAETEVEDEMEELEDEINSNRAAQETGEIDISHYQEEKENKEAYMTSLIEKASRIGGLWLELLENHTYLEFEIYDFENDYYELLVDVYEQGYYIRFNTAFHSMLNDFEKYVVQEI